MGHVRTIEWEQTRFRLLSIERLEDRALLAGNTTDGPGPNLIYDPATGNVSIGGDTTGVEVAGIDLQNCQSKFHPLPRSAPFESFLANTPNQISLGSVSDRLSLAGEFHLGPIFPRGLTTVESLAQFLTAAEYGGSVAPTSFDLILRSSDQVLLRDSFDDDDGSRSPTGPEIGAYLDVGDGHFVVPTVQLCPPDATRNLVLASRSTSGRSNTIVYRPAMPASRFEVSYVVAHNSNLEEITAETSSSRVQKAASDDAQLAHEFVMQPDGTQVSLLWLDSGRLVLAFSQPETGEVTEIDLPSEFLWRSNETYQVLLQGDRDANTLNLRINDQVLFASDDLPVQFDALNGLRFTDSTPANGRRQVDVVVLDDVTVVGQAADIVDVELSSTSSIDLELRSQANVDVAFPGEEFEFIVTVTNNAEQATAAATDVQIQELVGNGLSLTSATPSGNGTFSDGVWSLVDPLEPGDHQTLSLVVRVSHGVRGDRDLVNFAQVLSAGQQDIDSIPNNTDPIEDDQTVAMATSGSQIDLELTTQTNTTTALPGEMLEFVITLTNDLINANTNATGVQVQNLLPASLTVLESIATNGVYADSLWTLEDPLPPGGFAELTITANVNSNAVGGEEVRFGAEVVAANELDVDSTPANDAPEEDDLATGGIAVGIRVDRFVDLELSKVADQASVAPGDSVTWIVGITNNASNANLTATEIQVSDVIPSGVTLVSTVPTVGSYEDDIWSIDALPPGTTEALILRVRVDDTVSAGSSITNVARVLAAAEADVDSVPGGGDPTEDDEASSTITIDLIDLELSKTVSDDRPSVGQTVSITLSLSNNDMNSNLPATSVAVSAPLPGGLALESSASSEGTYDAATGLWTLEGPLDPGDTATLSLGARVLSSAAGSPIRTFAEVVSASQIDSDSTPDNGDGDPVEDDEDALLLTVEESVSIRGIKWNDEDGDGELDPDEPPLAGHTIFIDLNEDGIRQSDSEPAATTDGDGQYEFRGLEPGNYVIREQLPDGWEQTFPGRFSEIASPVLDEFHDVAFPTAVVFADLDGIAPQDVVLLDATRAIAVTDTAGAVQRELLQLGGRGAVAVADLDGDSDDDVILTDVNSSSLTVLESDNGARVERNIPLARAGVIEIGSSPLSPDSSRDLYFVNARDFTVTVFTSIGDFQYRAKTIDVGRNPAAAKSGDLNGNDFADIVVANYGDNTISVLHDAAAGGVIDRFSVEVGAGPSDLSIADFNNDGRDDVAVLSSTESSVSVLFNGDNGLSNEISQTFDLPTAGQPLSMEANDLNQDGHVDLLITNSEAGSISVLLNTRDGSFIRIDQALTLNPLVFDLGDDHLVVAGLDQSSDRIQSRAVLLDLSIGSHTVQVGPGQPVDQNFGNLCFVDCSVSSSAVLSSILPPARQEDDEQPVQLDGQRPLPPMTMGEQSEEATLGLDSQGRLPSAMLFNPSLHWQATIADASAHVSSEADKEENVIDLTLSTSTSPTMSPAALGFDLPPPNADGESAWYVSTAEALSTDLVIDELTGLLATDLGILGEIP